MPLYRCQGRNAGGETVSELFDADDPSQLVEELSARGWSQLAVELVERRPRGPLRSEELIVLGEEIASMARAGLPLDRALGGLSRDLRKGRLRAVLERLSADLRAGVPLDEALRRQEGVVPPVFAAVVKAGIRMNRLPQVLTTLNNYSRAMTELRTSIVGALYYPLVIVVLGLVVFVLFSYVAVPSWLELYEEFEIEVPVVARVAIELGLHPVQYVIAPLVAVLLIGLGFWRASRATPRGQERIMRFVYSLPLMGVLLRSSRLAAHSELLALLTENEVPLPEAVALAGRSSSDPMLRSACERIEAELRGGKKLADAVKDQRAYPELFAWLVAVGESRGMLTDSFRQLGDVYQRRAIVRAQLMRSVVPPLLVLVIGIAVVAFFTAAFYLPIFYVIRQVLMRY